MQSTDIRAFDPELVRKRKAEADCFIDQLKESPIQERILKEIWKRVIPTAQDLPKELRARTVLAVSEAIKAGTSTPEEMATLRKLQQALEKNSSIYFGNNGFNAEMPSVSHSQALIEDQRNIHAKVYRTLEALVQMEEDNLAKIQFASQKVLKEHREILAALRPTPLIPPLPEPAGAPPPSIRKKTIKFNRDITINIQDKMGNTPLHNAILEIRVYHTIRKYLRYGADSRIQNVEGDTPLHLAVRQNYKSILVAILRTGKVDLTLRNKAGNTCLDEATDEIRTRILKFQTEPAEVADTIEDASPEEVAEGIGASATGGVVNTQAGVTEESDPLQDR